MQGAGSVATLLVARMRADEESLRRRGLPVPAAAEVRARVDLMASRTVLLAVQNRLDGDSFEDVLAGMRQAFREETERAQRRRDGQ